MSDRHIELYKEKFSTSPLELLMEIQQNSTGMVRGWSPTEIVQMVLIRCISRSWGITLGGC